MNSPEGTVERRLIRKSALDGNVGERLSRIRQKIPGPVHTPLGQPSMRRHPEGLFERAGEVAY